MSMVFVTDPITQYLKHEGCIKYAPVGPLHVWIYNNTRVECSKGYITWPTPYMDIHSLPHVRTLAISHGQQLVQKLISATVLPPSQSQRL